MYVRCAECLASTWIELVFKEGLAEHADCAACQRRYVLDPIEPLGPTVREHYRRALSYSTEHDLDMASAYSVLLGIMSLEQAEILRLAGMPVHTPPTGAAPEPDFAKDTTTRDLKPALAKAAKASAKEAAGRPGVPDLDPGFASAIREGHLTVQQAVARGDRGACAQRLARRHRLRDELAYRVVDNRMRLADALAEQQQLEREQELAAEGRVPAAHASRRAVPRRRAGDATRAQKVVILGLGAAGLCVLTWAAWPRPKAAEPAPVAAATPAPVEAAPAAAEPAKAGAVAKAAPSRAAVRKDALGRVLEIQGSDPASVLVAFCDASSSTLGLEPVEITSTVPPFREARLGIFRDFSAPGSDFAIRMRHDEGSGRWIAGAAGDVPLAVAAAPKLPADALRIPVRRQGS